MSKKTFDDDRDDLAKRLKPVAAFEAMLRAKSSPARLLAAGRAAAAALDPDTIAILASWTDALDASVVRGLSELEADLRELALAHGWRLEGIWPTFQIDRGIEVRVEAPKRVVRIGGQAIDATDIDAIAGAIRDAVQGLVPRDFSAHDMLEQLRRSHAALLPTGGQLPVLDLYARFVVDSQTSRFWRDARPERFAGISIDQFRARLARMLEERATIARDGSELRLLPPLDPKDALFVHLPAEGRFGYVGRVEFVGPRP